MSESDVVSSIVDKIQAKKENIRQAKFKNKELEEEYNKAIKLLSNNKEFNLFLKTIVGNINLFSSRESLEPRDMFLSMGKKWVYLELIRPYLLTETRKEIENE